MVVQPAPSSNKWRLTRPISRELLYGLHFSYGKSGQTVNLPQLSFGKYNHFLSTYPLDCDAIEGNPWGGQSPYFDGNQNGNYHIPGNLTDAADFTGPLTIIVGLRWQWNAGNPINVVSGTDQSPGGLNQPYFVYFDTTTYKLRFARSNAGGYRVFEFPAEGLTWGATLSCVAAILHDGVGIESQATCYSRQLSGPLPIDTAILKDTVSSTSGSGTGPATSLNAGHWILNHPGSLQQFRGAAYFLFIWKRLLSVQEIAQVFSDPYTFMKPVKRYPFRVLDSPDYGKWVTEERPGVTWSNEGRPQAEWTPEERP